MVSERARIRFVIGSDYDELAGAGIIFAFPVVFWRGLHSCPLSPADGGGGSVELIRLASSIIHPSGTS